MDDNNPIMEIGRRLAELRRSGASGKHQDRRTRRARSRAEKNRRAINESKEG